MLRFIADGSFNNHIVRGLLRRNAGLDIVPHFQDVGLGGADDPAVLAWAAAAGRLLLTHRDTATIPVFADKRVVEGKPMPGVVIAPRQVAIGQAIDAILLFAECSHEGEWERKDRLPAVLGVHHAIGESKAQANSVDSPANAWGDHFPAHVAGSRPSNLWPRAGMPWIDRVLAVPYAPAASAKPRCPSRALRRPA